MKRLSRIQTVWSRDLAYAVGVIATDGTLSKDKRHMEITSKDEQLILTLRSLLKLTNKIGLKARGGSSEKKYFRLQFGDINFYNFLISIGIIPAKSKILGKLLIPEEYFFDFFRGCVDGDGSITTSIHPESKHLQLKLRLTSASKPFLVWIKEVVTNILKIEGGWIHGGKDGMFTLCYGKADSILLLNSMYAGICPCLHRKYEVARHYLTTKNILVI